MKKFVLTIAILFGLGMTTFADPDGGGLFQRGAEPEKEGVYGNRDGGTPMLPNHGLTGNQDANTPLGTGIAVLSCFGAAYLFGKKHKAKSIVE